MVLLAALAAVSCTRENWKEMPLAGNAAHAIDLGVQTAASPVVRATVDGDNDYNENTVYHIDYYIFNEDPTTNSYAEAITFGRISYVADGIRPVDETTAKANAKRVILDNLVDSGDLTDDSGWVFAIANLPEQPYFDYPVTLGDLQGIVLENAAFVQCDNNNLEGFVRKDNRFVMASDVVAFTLTQRVATSVIAPLKRVAAKIQLNLNIVDELEQVLSASNTKHWVSQYDKVQIYLQDAIQYGTLGGTPLSYTDVAEDDPSRFFTSPRYAMFSDGTTPGTAGGTVVSNLIGELSSKPIGDYQLIQKQDPAGTFWWLDNDENPTTTNTGNPYMVWSNVTIEKDFWPVKSVPLYSYPVKWNAADAHAPFVKIIVPWVADGDAAPTEFYYKLALPKIEYAAGDRAFELRSNYCYVINLDITVLGASADEIPVDVFGNYYVVGWNDEDADMGGPLDAGRYLDVPKSEYDMYGNELEIPVSSSHTLEVIDVTSAYTNYQNENPTTGHLTQSSSPSSVTGNNFHIAAQGRNSVLLRHTPETSLDNVQPRDVAPITYTFRVRQQGAGGLTSQLVTVKQYPPLMIEAQHNSDNGPILPPTWFRGTGHTAEDGYVFLNGVRSNQNQSDNRNNTNFNMYVITTSVLPAAGIMQNYILGDPRSTTIDNNLGNSNNNWSYSGTPAGGGTQRRLTYYYPANQSQAYDDVIAPKFRIASSFGASPKMSRNNALQRCASYQEDGYPAGRWRLPTAAEIVYMASLTNRGLIPRLLGNSGTGSTYYWSNSGYVTVPNAQNTSGTITATHDASGNRNVRCVYDEWYWEGDTVDKTSFRWGDRQR